MLFVIVNIGFTQTDTLNNESVNPMIDDCETAAITSQTKLIQTEFYETEKLNENLERWSFGCGEVEPIQRLRILIKINQKLLTESDYRKYVINQIEKFKDRVITSGESDYQKVYEAHAGYFSYVPLKGTFDAKTKEIAKQLLEQQEEGTAAYAFALLFSEEINKFESEVLSEDSDLHELYISSKQEISEENYDHDIDEAARLAFELGWWMPDKKLDVYFHSNPYIGFKLGGLVHENWGLDINLALVFLIQEENYRINVQDSIQETDSDLIFSISAALVRTQHLGKNWFLDGSVGIGVNGTNTDIRIPEDERDEDDNNEFYTLFTFDFNVGLMVRKQLKNGRKLGIGCTYHYAPYGLDNRLVDVFGDQSLRVGVSLMY